MNAPLTFPGITTNAINNDYTAYQAAEGLAKPMNVATLVEMKHAGRVLPGPPLFIGNHGVMALRPGY